MKLLMKKFLLILGIVSGLVFAGSAFLAPPVMAGTAAEEVCKGIGAVDGSGNCTRDDSLSTVIRSIINIFSVVVGIVAVIMIMVSGFKYVTANGDSGNLTSAKQTLIYAIIGLVVVALSQFIVRFVLDQIK